MATNDWQISIHEQLHDDKQVVIERTYGSTDRYWSWKAIETSRQVFRLSLLYKCWAIVFGITYFI